MRVLDQRQRAAARVFALAFALLTFCAASALARVRPRRQAQQQQGEQPPTPSARGAAEAESLLSQLGLTPEQVARMREIREQSVPQARELSRRLAQARRALDEAIYSDTPDEALVEQRVREVADAQAALVRLRAQTELRVRGVLTPEQLQTFRVLRERARARQRLERRMNRRGRPGRQ
jgi:Spy/CpxP family protein refolding chaperone